MQTHDVPAADQWLELAVEAEPEAVESIAEAFGRWGQGVAVEHVVSSSRDGDVVAVPEAAPVVVKTYLPLRDPSWCERRRQIEMAVWALGQLRRVGPLAVRAMREEDWANAWKEHFFVHRVGRRTVIVPSWRQAEYAPRAEDVVLLLDPGMAFGTGLHPTTRLCLRALEGLVQPGARVLDLGTGSGVLAIAAAKLGARQVTAVEIDPVAVEVSRHNVQRNGAGDVVQVRLGSLQAVEPAGGFDLAVANITIRVLLDLQLGLLRAMRPGGRAVLSGVLAERAGELVQALETAGWQHERTEQEDDWVAVTVVAPSAREAT